MLKWIAIVLLAALALQTGFKVFIVANYRLNREAITQRYCVNKAQPSKKCHGKCHLNKLLKEDDQRSDQGKGPSKETNELSPSLLRNGDVFREHAAGSQKFLFQYLLSTTAKRAFSFFHPPCQL